MASAATSKLIERRTAKPAPFRKIAPLAIPARLLHDPRERLVCAQLAKVRRCLRLPAEDFARALGIRPAKLAQYEAQERSWPEDELQRARPRLAELCAVAQGDLDEACATLAELESAA